MTVQYEIPIIRYAADGVNRDFDFAWSSSEESDNRIKVAGRVLNRGEYRIEDFDPEVGGRFVLVEAPTLGPIEVYRETPVTQELDYVQDEPFPADLHEFQMDKDTRILQEIIEGARGFGGDVNLEAEQLIDRVNILNDSGTDATIFPWNCSGQFAGVFLGAAVSSAPADGDPTTRPDGFMWLELETGAPAPGAGLVWPVSLLATLEQLTIPAQIQHQVLLFPDGRSTVGNISSNTAYEDAAWLDNPITGSNQIWVRYTITTRASSNNTTITDRSNVAVDQWVDAWAAIAADGFVRFAFLWFTSQPASAVINFTVELAPDTGGGAPDEALKITRDLSFSYDATP